MDEERYKQLLDAILESKKKVEKLSFLLEVLKRDITAVQEKVSQDLASKIDRSACQFCQKGNEVQFNFNAKIST